MRSIFIVIIVLLGLGFNSLAQTDPELPHLTQKQQEMQPVLQRINENGIKLKTIR